MQAWLQRDDTPLPVATAREGYFGVRHLEYWLSGYRDALAVLEASGLGGRADLRILDFGGASGRVIRHFRELTPQAELFLSEIHPPHVLLARSLFQGRVRTTRNHSVPSLPFSDGALDCVYAFSVFTHIDADDTAWLSELRRIVKPGGFLYLTIHDEGTWRALERETSPDFWNPMLREFCLEEKKSTSDGHDRFVQIYNDKPDYNCNVYLTQGYMQRHWFPLFKSWKIFPLAHDYQSAVLLEVGD